MFRFFCKIVYTYVPRPLSWLFRIYISQVRHRPSSAPSGSYRVYHTASPTQPTHVQCTFLYIMLEKNTLTRRFESKDHLLISQMFQHKKFFQYTDPLYFSFWLVIGQICCVCLKTKKIPCISEMKCKIYLSIYLSIYLFCQT